MIRNNIQTRTAESTAQMTAMVAHIVTLSCWFEVEPQPDDRYDINVKADVAHVAFPVLSPQATLNQETNGATPGTYSIDYDTGHQCVTGSAVEAVRKAAGFCYLAPARFPAHQKRLEDTGRTAWAYGFSSVVIRLESLQETPA